MFGDSNITYVSIVDKIFTQNYVKDSQTEQLSSQSVSIQTIRRKTQQTQANEFYDPYPKIQNADLSHLQNSLDKVFILLQEKPLKIIFQQKDQILQHHYISLRLVLGQLSSNNRTFSYYQGKLKIYEDLLYTEIYPFYPQSRNLQFIQNQITLKNISFITQQTIGTISGALLQNSKLLPSLHVSKIIQIYHFNDLTISCDNLGRILVIKDNKLISGVIIRDKSIKRDFEEGIFTSSFSLNIIRKNYIYAAISGFDGTVITFQFNQQRNIEIQRIEELSDNNAAGMIISSQFNIKPPALQVKSVKLYENSPQFMQAILNSGVLALDGQNQVKLYCGGQFICAYESQGVISFDYIDNNVIMLTQREILCFELFSGITVNRPYFKSNLDYIYDKIEVVNGGEKAVVFLYNQNECELREIALRPARNNIGQDIYKLLQE
ncbi:hypothetical protein SS50377_23279 [Spironucleus salmonicida]|uniref:Uncharacterized protein n=1 Tax=Spironucleus salmonicida TaxID=348837 RepID=V6LR34_9EUKA|nr:hypothetical protein SS50377_23279 [Spironucleus salmonicida]|eukprot:EST47147.1 Hypothetical protein SS50377_12658 [Spironucleus salmonicida]